MNNMQRELTVTVRDSQGKGPARRLRQSGLIPGVLYGGGKDHLKISVDPRVLRKAMDPDRKLNTYFKLSVEGEGGASVEDAIIADHQIDAVHMELIHVDFLRVDPKTEIVTKIPVEYTGRAAGVLAGGKLLTYRRFVKIAACPGDVPVALNVDVSPLAADQTLRLEACSVPKVRFLEDPRVALAYVAPPKAKKVEEKDDKKKKKAAKK